MDVETIAGSPVRAGWIVVAIVAVPVVWLAFAIFSPPEPTADFVAFEARNEAMFSYEPPEIAGAKFTGRTVENGGALWGDEFIQKVWRYEHLTLTYEIEHDADVETAIGLVVADLEALGWQLARQEPTESLRISYEDARIFDDLPADEGKDEADVLRVYVSTVGGSDGRPPVRRIVIDLRPDRIDEKSEEAISVVVRLPKGGHGEPVDGWVRRGKYDTVAKFWLDRAVITERIGTTDEFRMTPTGAPLETRVTLPEPGRYGFKVGT